jgi:hypothetical protein
MKKVSARQRGVRHSRVRLRLSLAPCGLREWDGSLAKCSTSASGEETGVILGRGGEEIFAERRRCETVACRDSLVAFSGEHGMLAS